MLKCRQGLRASNRKLSPKPFFVQVQLYGDVPTGAARFADLARGIQGVGYKRSKVDFVNAVRWGSLGVWGLDRCLPHGWVATWVEVISAIESGMVSLVSTPMQLPSPYIAKRR